MLPAKFDVNGLGAATKGVLVGGSGGSGVVGCIVGAGAIVDGAEPYTGSKSALWRKYIFRPHHNVRGFGSCPVTMEHCSLTLLQGSHVRPSGPVQIVLPSLQH